MITLNCDFCKAKENLSEDDAICCLMNPEKHGWKYIEGNLWCDFCYEAHIKWLKEQEKESLL